MSRLIVRNHGPLILESNYWDLPECALGKLLVSLNAGAFRILLPHAGEAWLPDMLAAGEVVVSRGPWPESGVADAFEVLFDDRTDDPFALFLAAASFDRLPVLGDVGREFTLSAWTRPRRGKPYRALERPCHYRIVTEIPWLRPRRTPPLT